ncbi:MAG: protein translocase subunit SecF, partial [Candidatus Komeilibacteria bacterium]|nr:protein translocase subunit SecF [Candidatus Komeilibacteria bacterium]
MFQIVQKRKFWYIISVATLVLGLVFIWLWGLKFSIDFTGGSLLELQFSQNNPDLSKITVAVEAAGVKGALVQPAGEQTVIIRSESLPEETHQIILKGIKDKFAPDQISVSESRFDSIGPVIGKEMKQKTIWAIILVLLAIIAYIGFSFRKVSFPVPSWKYGVAAVVALFHDLVMTVGFYALLGKLAGAEVDSLFIMALLTVLGFSVHDTIVTFDRIRENLLRRRDQSFENIVNISINETIVRSINTSLTAVLALTA